MWAKANGMSENLTSWYVYLYMLSGKEPGGVVGGPGKQTAVDENNDNVDAPALAGAGAFLGEQGAQVEGGGDVDDNKDKIVFGDEDDEVGKPDAADIEANAAADEGKDEDNDNDNDDDKKLTFIKGTCLCPSPNPNLAQRWLRPQRAHVLVHLGACADLPRPPDPPARPLLSHQVPQRHARRHPPAASGNAQGRDRQPQE